MTSPVLAARTALQRVMTEAVKDYSAEVLDYITAEYASDVAVVIASMDSTISRDRFAVPSSVPFAEEVNIAVNVFPTNNEYNETETLALVTDIIHAIVGAVTQDYTLGGSPSVVRCTPVEWLIDSSTLEECLAGQVTFAIEFRIDRRVQ